MSMLTFVISMALLAAFGAVCIVSIRRCTYSLCVIGWVLLLCFIGVTIASAEPLRPLIVKVVVDQDATARMGDPKRLQADLAQSAGYLMQLGVILMVDGPITWDVKSLSSRYVNLAFYRMDHMDDEGADVLLFITGRPLEHGLLGFASVGDAGHHARAIVYWQDDVTDSETIAHELAHTLGAVHDGEGECKDTTSVGYIMGPAENGRPEFSPCTIRMVRGLR